MKKDAKKPDPKAKNDKSKKPTEPEEPEIDDSGPHIFRILEEEARKNLIPEEKILKAKLLDYTVAILHPNIITVSLQCRKIIDTIQKNNFVIFNFLYKTLTEQECRNLYFKHITQDYFPDIVSHMTCGPSAILILTNKEEFYLDEDQIKTAYDSPVIRWKEMIGNKDPSIAKNEGGLRGEFGTNLIENAFWGSDNPSDAYRELSMFMLPLPAVPPVFVYDENLIKMETIMKFLSPPKPDHPDISGRLDLIGQFGPICEYHILDLCICTNCRPKIKKILKDNKVTLKKATDKIIKEELIDKNLKQFCERCKEHFNKWTHLFSGMEGTHICTNEEIDNMIYDMNMVDLLEILTAEKGTSARTIISKFDIKKPPTETVYTIKHVEKLMKHLKMDYYNRFNFTELQNLIMEDRRVRMNYWVCKMLQKPFDHFPNPKLLNFDGTEKELKEMANPHSKKFTILRNEPIKVINKERQKAKDIVLQHPILQKEKLTNHEVSLKIEKLSQKNIGLISDPKDKIPKTQEIKSNLFLLRNYHLEMIKSKNEKNALKKEKEKLEQLKYY